MSYYVNESCITCGACYLRCPVDAVHYVFDTDKYAIDNTCISCGGCADECPIGAIEPDADTLSAFNAAGGRIIFVGIDAEKCIGCSLCKKACPVGAISGVVKQPFVIDQGACVQCGKCVEKCKKDAFIVQRVTLNAC